MRELWLCVGMTISMTEQEEELLLGDIAELWTSTYTSKEAVLRKILAEGRARLDGETYIPESSIADYNVDHDTYYVELDRELDFKGRSIAIESKK